MYPSRMRHGAGHGRGYSKPGESNEKGGSRLTGIGLNYSLAIVRASLSVGIPENSRDASVRLGYIL
jgi:hypothetical protein